MSYPVLSYYRSIDAQNDWLAALEAVLDAATLVMATADDPACGAATLMHRAGSRTAKQLSALFVLAVDDVEAEPGQGEAVMQLLASAGYAVADVAAAARRFLTLRADYAGEIEALAQHLGANRAILLPHAS